jgi:type I restriction-modification system DNA methylase subunit
MNKDFMDCFHSLTKTHSPHSVFADFCEACAIALSNVVDKEQFKKREKRYLDIASKYKEMDTFSKMFAFLVNQMEDDTNNENLCDRLGEVYSQLKLTNDRNGQVFTPTSVCNIMSEITFDDTPIKKQGFIKYYEPCCGGGAIAIAYIKAMLNKGYNPQRQLLVTTGDIDLTSVHMCYIQLSLLGVPAVVYHRNELTLEEYSRWYSAGYFLGGFYGREKLLSL